MNILILANNDVGLFKFRKELLEKLVENGYQVWVSLPKGEFIEEIVKIGCKFIETKLSRHGTNPCEDLNLLLTYKRLIKEVKPDIVLTYTIKPNIYGGIASALAGVPYVMNITGLGTAVENPGLLQMITITLYRLAVKKVQTVFFQNEENEKFFTSKGLAEGKHKIIPGSGVNLQKFVPTEYPSDEKVEFAFISRIMKEKGIDQYLEAAKILRAKYPQTRFHICGFCEQDYEEQIKEFQNKGIIIYHGFIKDVKPIYGQIHCTVHPTYYPEGLSNVLLESAASARPIITTNRSGCKEVVEDGKNGFLVKEKDSADLINKLEKFILLDWEQRKKMGLSGRAKVEKEFDRAIVINSYLKEIER